MVWATLDKIVRRNLLEKGLPIHYYFEQLVHSSSCLRELHIDTLKAIRYAELPVNQVYMSVDLPDDFSTDLGLSIPVGGELHPVPHRDSLNPLRIHDTTGAFTAYQDNTTQQNITIFGFNPNWLWFWNINDYGEPTGRYFGAHGAGKLNGYTVVKERRQIQLTGTFTSPTVILMYVSDGQSADNATQIDVEAFATFQAYINWKSSPNAQNDFSPEGRMFYNERRKLVARLSDLSITDIRDAILGAYAASIKN